MKSSSGHVLTSSEAAARLDITDATIRAQRIKGKLHGVKHGGVWIFLVDEIERYARENQIRRKGGRARSSPPSGRADQLTADPNGSEGA